uniref:Xanthine dehydrogenase n=1 Tax=Timspurckia oligopyrenoides TaxID=708627 RepID=A0A7S1ER10_9RHOD|mmetsp:Transcript_13149/g.23643  ORF Transcript_13149/g.23643 Transcript_13149/m.23643 type:complete len:1390 (+) Transcript_13149:49-4218(+)
MHDFEKMEKDSDTLNGEKITQLRCFSDLNFSRSIVFYLNGIRKNIHSISPSTLLIDYLRIYESLTGTKLGCGEGGCGACTVSVSSYNANAQKFTFYSLNSCLTPIFLLHGCHVFTVESLSSRNPSSFDIHSTPIPSILSQFHGSQCGFCTPGIVMSMHSLMHSHLNKDNNKIELTNDHIEHAFDGNLCRCTGYRPILDAFKELVQCTDIEELDTICPKQLERRNELNGMDHHNKLERNWMSIEQEMKDLSARLVAMEDHESKWFRVSRIEELGLVKNEYSDAQLIGGNTELGIDKKFKRKKIPVFVHTGGIPELKRIQMTDFGVEVGAAATLSELCEALESVITNKSDEESYKTRVFCGIREQLKWFAGTQIRNVSSVAGNVVTASPISDLNPLWISSGTVFQLYSCTTQSIRDVQAKDFFIGYRKVDLMSHEILYKVKIPWTSSQNEYFYAFKTSRRKEDDISIVSSGIRIQVEEIPSNKEFLAWKFVLFEVGFGGLAERCVFAESVAEKVVGMNVNSLTLECILELIENEFQLDDNVPGGMPEYRRTLALGFITKAFYRTMNQVLRANCIVDSRIDESIETMQRPVSKASQVVQENQDVKSRSENVGKSVAHLGGKYQASGKAEYLDDSMLLQNELHAAFVLSSEAHARILSMDISIALKVEGVVDVITADDVRGLNEIGQAPAYDEEVFVKETVKCIGQPLGLVVATSKQIAIEASFLVKVEYQKLHAIVSLEEAIDQKSFAKDIPERRIECGDVESVFADDRSVVVQGEVRIGGQEHFYLEPHGSIAIPVDHSREMMIVSSTQSVCKTQLMVARALGWPAHRIVCRTKRIGGGFGGKETRNMFMSCAVAVAANKLGKPVRLVLERDVDMAISGQRHAFLAKYKAAALSNGHLVALDVQMYHNIGYSLDLSIPILDRSLFHLENAYQVANVRFLGRACVTNTPSNTAFRGFGGPQGMFVTENIIEHLSKALEMSTEQFRSMNLYNSRLDSTPYGMSVNGERLEECWNSVLLKSDFETRSESIKVYNETHHFRKRGIAAIPSKFGISFTFRTFNQAAALIHVYTDGSVLISHGGVEMGQGLHTKMCQVAADALRIEMERVFISETSSDKIPNASPTAASASSDMYGMAILDACSQLNSRLDPYRMSNGTEAKDESWCSAVMKAYFDRVNLSAQGFYRTPELDVVDLGSTKAEERRGSPFYYFTYGAAVSEVEVDVLTGEFIVLRSDIVMDVGQSLNPALDVGQIEGAFVQGMGWCTMEEIVRGGDSTHAWVKSGKMFTVGPSTYKIPGFCNIPVDFRVSLLPNVKCEKPTVHSSKAVGEPPLFLGASVFFAIKNACYAARSQFGIDSNLHFVLDSPASVERIRMACTDSISMRITKSSPAFRPKLTL